MIIEGVTNLISAMYYGWTGDISFCAILSLHDFFWDKTVSMNRYYILQVDVDRDTFGLSGTSILDTSSHCSYLSVILPSPALKHEISKCRVQNVREFALEDWLMIFIIYRFRGTGEYDKVFQEGVYNCAGCGTPLYKSTTKFNSGCGWPAFYEGFPGAINRTPDPDGRRTEITCAACGGHLGHVFKGEGFSVPTDERHCVNSVSIKFVPADATPSL
ncbi:hypothetical protein Gotur_009688 [Gossypium turneri]